jgi:hypothetical protein
MLHLYWLALHCDRTYGVVFVSFCCLCNNQSFVCGPLLIYCRHKDNIPLALQRYEELSSRRAAQLLDYSRQAASSRRRTLIVLFWCFCRRCGSSSTEPRHAASFAVPILVVCHLLLALAICPFADEPVHATPLAPPPKCQPSPNSVSRWRSAPTKQGVQCMHIACSTTTVR